MISVEEGYPFRRYLGLAMVHLGWSPATFWAATPHEFFAGLELLTPNPKQDARARFAAFKRSLG